jgi:ligand-binding sensor domain-containing protein
MRNKIFLFLMTVSVLAKSQILPTENWVIYNKSNSPLPSNFITSVLQDKFGLYWISMLRERIGGNYVGGGLAKFDGSNWEFFSTLNSNIPSDGVEALAIDSLGKIWIATYDSGIGVFDRNIWTNFNKKNSPLPSNNIFCISIEKNGAVWIGTRSDGILKFYNNVWSIYNSSNSGLPSDKINFIFIDEFGVKWIGTDFGGLVSFNDSVWIRQGKGILTPSSNVFAKALQKDKLGNFWLSAYVFNYGFLLAKFKDTVWHFYDSSKIGFKPSFTYNAITVDKNNKKWFGTTNGLLSYDDSVWNIYANHNSPLPVNWIGSLTTDNYNNKIVSLWHLDTQLGSFKGYGLAFFNEVRVLLSSDPSTFNDESKIFSLYQNYPNPFNPSTVISYQLSAVSYVTLKVFDILGKEIETLVDEVLEPGIHHSTFHIPHSALSSGVYFYQLRVGSFVETKKMILLR